MTGSIVRDGTGIFWGIRNGLLKSAVAGMLNAASKGEKGVEVGMRVFV